MLTVHGGGSEAAFLFFHLFGESPAFISCREGPYVSCVLMILAHKRCGLVT